MLSIGRPNTRVALVILATLVMGASLGVYATERAVVEARLLEDLKYLAGKECEGRGIRTEGINKAADHIAKEFQKAGLKPAADGGSYFQPFDVTGGAKLGEGNRLVLRGPQSQRIELEVEKQFNVIGMAAKGKVEAPVVFAGYGISAGEPKYDDYAGLDVAGKIVVVLRRSPQANSQSGPFSGVNNPHGGLLTKAGIANVNKAAGLIFVNENTFATDNKDRLLRFDEHAQSREVFSLPAVHLRRQFADHMVRSALGRDLAELEKDIDQDLKPRSKALDGWSAEMELNIQRSGLAVKNVVGVLEGSGPLAKETVVLGAHYDHLGFGGSGSLARGSNAIHHGADDNASGTTALIELARRFGEQRERQGRRLVFIAFSAEESGLLGSIHYCNKPLFPLDSTVAMVNMDMVGRLREDKLTIGGMGTAKTFSTLIDDLNKKHELQITKDKTGFGPSDHSSFYAKKIPVFFFFTGMHEQYHRPTDTWETVNIPGIRKIVELVQDLTQHLSTVDPRPEYVLVAGSFNPGRISVGGPRGPRLGVMPANYDENEKDGVVLQSVSEDGPAKKAGLLGGDRITKIADKPVTNVNSYMAIMASLKRGDTVDITVDRKGKTIKIPVKLE